MKRTIGDWALVNELYDVLSELEIEALAKVASAILNKPVRVLDKEEGTLEVEDK